MPTSLNLGSHPLQQSWLVPGGLKQDRKTRDAGGIDLSQELSGHLMDEAFSRLRFQKLGVDSGHNGVKHGLCFQTKDSFFPRADSISSALIDEERRPLTF